MNRSRVRKDHEAPTLSDLKMIELAATDDAIRLLDYLQELQMKYFPEDFSHLKIKPKKKQGTKDHSTLRDTVVLTYLANTDAISVD